MKKTAAAILIVIATLCVCACVRHRYPPRLVMADSLAEAEPDSALLLLAGMRADTAAWPEAARRYYDLVSIKAADYNYAKFSSGTVADRLVAYYEGGGDRALLPDAYYYAGRVYSEMYDAPKAALCFAKAIGTADDDSHYLLRCKAYSQMGYLYKDMRLYTKALDAFRRSYELRKGRANALRMIYVERDLERAFADLGRRDSALHYYEMALRLADENHIADMSACVHVQMASLFIDLQEYGLAEEHLKPALDYADPNDINAVMSNAAILYSKTGRMDSAMACNWVLVEKGSADARKDAYRRLADYYAEVGESRKAIELYQMSNLLADSVYDISAVEAVAQVGAVYDYSFRETENELLKAQNEAQRYEIACIVVVAVFVLGLLSLVLCRERKKSKRLASELKIYEQKRKAMEAQPEMLSIIETEIYRRLDTAIKSRKNLTDADWEQLAAVVDEHYPGFCAKLRGICRMSEADFRICLLLKLRLRLKDIAQLVNLSLSGLSSVRSKLYFRAYGENGSATQWDEVIDGL